MSDVIASKAKQSQYLRLPRRYAPRNDLNQKWNKARKEGNEWAGSLFGKKEFYANTQEPDELYYMLLRPFL
ncbi:MAG: hypothetical protein C0392_14505 [Syntrophus sp. (in: bacteria)]|nr:hypothetical protein [Syntrophus sp. (in: bacteria)]